MPEASVVEWWHLARSDKGKVLWDLTELDMREEPSELAGRIQRMLDERYPSDP
jgi:hypothetical protein